ncbi:MAG: iron hydrogenase small subunit [Desulfobacterales bacterium]|nr:iron hydrogenase small subunit [Desulfobacterales bacterium]MDD4073143.1 iron hydrogenase small subunit [Desulfobacterales bacterium]MDD4393593.1 iron hydrogenase small subunit [Desulfobacterales bacterium]
MKNIVNVTRRQFIKIAGMAAGATLYTWNFTKMSFAAANDYIMQRQESVYVQDTKMKFRRSQDNPSVKALYAKYLHEPNSHMAHQLLHTEYTDRSPLLMVLKAKGMKLKV